jgi:hypothetical protein
MKLKNLPIGWLFDLGDGMIYQREAGISLNRHTAYCLDTQEGYALDLETEIEDWWNPETGHASFKQNPSIMLEYMHKAFTEDESGAFKELAVQLEPIIEKVKAIEAMQGLSD